MSVDRLDIVAATVIRVAPEGFTAPYVLAAVRDGDRVSLVRVVTPDDTAPPPGTALQLIRTEDGTPVYQPLGG